ncbi:hypothetical protein ABIC30_000355 [Methylobacterium sp. 1030]
MRSSYSFRATKIGCNRIDNRFDGRFSNRPNGHVNRMLRSGLRGLRARRALPGRCARPTLGAPASALARPARPGPVRMPASEAPLRGKTGRERP